METATVDDALDLPHAPTAAKLPAKAERVGDDAKLDKTELGLGRCLCLPAEDPARATST
ncbi:hypothetical protein ACL07V_36035 [Streptomyces sp. MB22_4]|uniref:hypothetical protein n=1 Tax=Streptomyces sp. MB22_4 TaxID=3383120 RepID=UPI0039A3203D